RTCRQFGRQAPGQTIADTAYGARIGQSLLDADRKAAGQRFADVDEAALDIAGAAVQAADHAFGRQYTARRAQVARAHADFVDTELAVERFTAAQERGAHREQQSDIAPRVVGAMPQQQPRKLLDLADRGIRHQINTRALCRDGDLYPSFHGQSGAQGLDIQDGAGNVSLEGAGRAPQLQALAIGFDGAAASAQGSHRRQLASRHYDMKAAHQSGVDSIARKIKARPQSHSE